MSHVVRNPSLIAYGVLSVLLSMALFATGSIMTNPTYEELGYLVAEVLTLLCLVISGVFMFVMRPNRSVPRRVHAYGFGVGLSMLCWIVVWARHPFSDGDRVLMSLVALHGLFWGARCVALAAQSEAMSVRSAFFASIGAAACSAGIILATQDGMTKLSAVTAAGCYMLCLGLQMFLVWFLLALRTASKATSDVLSPVKARSAVPVAPARVLRDDILTPVLDTTEGARVYCESTTAQR